MSVDRHGTRDLRCRSSQGGSARPRFGHGAATRSQRTGYPCFALLARTVDCPHRAGARCRRGFDPSSHRARLSSARDQRLRNRAVMAPGRAPHSARKPLIEPHVRLWPDCGARQLNCGGVR